MMTLHGSQFGERLPFVQEEHRGRLRGLMGNGGLLLFAFLTLIHLFFNLSCPKL